MEDSKKINYPILESGTVKDFESKVKNIGRPSIFVGSSLESEAIAEKIKEGFSEKDFDVNVWYDGVFGKTRSSGGTISNVEWLKNFTDIYDFAIFIFVPEDKIVSQSRFDFPHNKARKASGTRHNVIFEFGMFMGRIGAKKTFILYDDKTDPFVKYFFTDLIENLKDTSAVPNNNFRVELYAYKGDYESYIKSKRWNFIAIFLKMMRIILAPLIKLIKVGPTGAELPYEPQSIETAIDKIKNRIENIFDDVEINFLPATSLAIGYFKNCINIFASIVHTIKGDLSYPAKWKQKDLDETEFSAITERIKRAKNVKLKIVIPPALEGAIQENINKDITTEKFKTIAFPGANRPLTLACLRSSLSDNSENLIFYDIPTTMNSSLDAIKMVTPYDQIEKLLKEKERRNFRKAIEYKISIEKDTGETKDINNYIEVISRDDFLKEIS